MLRAKNDGTAGYFLPSKSIAKREAARNILGAVPCHLGKIRRSCSFGVGCSNADELHQPFHGRLASNGIENELVFMGNSLPCLRSKEQSVDEHT